MVEKLNAKVIRNSSAVELHDFYVIGSVLQVVIVNV